MLRKLLPAATLISLLMSASTAQVLASTAQARVKHATHMAAPQHAMHMAAPQHVACTVLGCQPIPPACVPKEEHTFGGTPTGYDTILCPPGVWPF
jgi:hypothetical protein